MKTHQIKKELKEGKEVIINPNAEDTSTDENFQKVIETAVAEKTEENNIELDDWKLNKTKK